MLVSCKRDPRLGNALGMTCSLTSAGSCGPALCVSTRCGGRLGRLEAEPCPLTLLAMASGRLCASSTCVMSLIVCACAMRVFLVLCLCGRRAHATRCVCCHEHGPKGGFGPPLAPTSRPNPKLRFAQAPPACAQSGLAAGPDCQGRPRPTRHAPTPSPTSQVPHVWQL